MRNPLAVSTNTYHGFSLDQALAGIARAGFEYVELTAVKGYTEHVDWSMSRDELRGAKDMLRYYGLKAVGLSGHSNLMEPSGVENFERNIELAAKLGCEYIVTSVGEAHGDKTEIADDSALVAVLKMLGSKCKRYGIKLVLETHGNNYATGQGMLELVNKVGSSSVGINYDTANVIFYGDVSPEQDLVNCVDKVYFVHLKDKLGANQEWNFPAIGQGYVDFTGIFDILQANNYKGPISVEIEFTSKGPSGLEEVNQAVQDSYAYLQQYFD